MSWFSELGLTEKDVENLLASYLHAHILTIMAYGIYTSAYFVALYLTLSRGTERPRIGSAVLITMMWILITIHASIFWANLDYTFIQHGDTKETQVMSTLVLPSTSALAQNIVGKLVGFISRLLADMTMIWRFWGLYGRRWSIIVIPGLSFGVGAVSFIIRTIWMYTSDKVWKTNQVANMELIFISSTVFTNVFCTIAIIYRIVSVGGWRKSLKTYRGLVEIIIESCIIYTGVHLVQIGLEIHTQYFTDMFDARVYYASAVEFSITGFAPTLIIARVAAGHARPDDSWTRTSLPHMRSNMRSLAESLRFAGPAAGTVDLERSVHSEGNDEGIIRMGRTCFEISKPASDEGENTEEKVSLQQV